MTDFKDPYPELPIMIDVGGIKYYMGIAKPVELAYKTRSDYIKEFGNNPRNEYILRKYMFPDLADKSKLKFSNLDEKNELIALLEKRAKKLQDSTEFTSSVLKNSIFQQSFIKIQQLLQKLKGVEIQTPIDQSKLKFPDILTCTKNKKYIKTISEDRLLELILELSWMLLHPDEIPKDIQCNWASLIKKLDTLRLGDIMTMIHEEKERRAINDDKKPLNYLERIDLKKVGKASSIKNALDQAKELALLTQADNAKNDMKKRLEILLNMLEVKKYLSKQEFLDPARKNVISDDVGKISKNLIANPMRGGNPTTLEKPLGIAINPLYDYFRITFDPIYSKVVEPAINSITSGKPDTTKTILIPSLLSLLHLCNNLNRNQINPERNNFGVYRIINVDDTIMNLINELLNTTTTYLEEFKEPESKFTFNKQIFNLPRVRLSTLLNTYADKTAKDPDTIPYIQFFQIGKNINIPTKEEFLDPNKPDKTEIQYNELTSFFNPKDLFIIYTDPDNYKENIPMNMFQIDLNTVDVAENSLQVNNLDDNYFNKNKMPELFLDQLLKIKEFHILNDGEIALSIFLAFKELMPK
jgi:hypothetical protein